MTTNQATNLHQLPAEPTGQPAVIRCSCGTWDFMGIDNTGMRAAITDHLTYSAAHAETDLTAFAA